VAFYGDASKSIDFFGEVGHPCPTYTNPADFFMELLQTTDEEDLERTRKMISAAANTLPQVWTKAILIFFFGFQLI